MLWLICLECARSYRPLFFPFSYTDIRIWTGKNFAWARIYIATSDNALHEKWSGRQTAEDYQCKISVDSENVDEFIKIRKYFPRQKFAPYGISFHQI